VADPAASAYTVPVPPTTTGQTLKTIGQLSTVGLSFVLALVMGFGGGYWLDGRLGTSPWLAMLGFAMGVAAGVLNVVRVMRLVAADDAKRLGRGPGGA
jgi:ATP synthase protein I